MSDKSEKRESFLKKKGVRAAAVVILIPAVLLLCFRFLGPRRYYLCSLILILLAMGAFFAAFEERGVQARELVTLAVMSAIAVVSRMAFIMINHFKPMMGIVMITGMAFGSEAGFLTGAVSGFVSNFIFGQGPSTPWQMFAFGIGGFLAGVFSRKGFLDGEKPVRTAVFGGLTILFIVGPLLDLSSLFTFRTEVNWAALGAVLLSGIPVNVIHAAATVLTLLLASRPLTEKLERMKVKYGMMNEDEK